MNHFSSYYDCLSLVFWTHLSFWNTAINRVCVLKVISLLHLICFIPWGEILPYKSFIEHCCLQVINHLIRSIRVHLFIVIPETEIWDKSNNKSTSRGQSSYRYQYFNYCPNSSVTIIFAVTLWRSSVQTSASGLSWYPPHSVCEWPGLRAMRALPTDHLSPGCDQNLTQKQDFKGVNLEIKLSFIFWEKGCQFTVKTYCKWSYSDYFATWQ